MWGTVLSDPLAIADLVGRYPANYLMARMPIPVRLGFTPDPMPDQGTMRY